MDLNLKTIDQSGNTININVIGTFQIPELNNREYIMYSFVDENPNNEMGKVILGEVIRNGKEMRVLGIKNSEINLVTAFFNEIVYSEGEK